MMFKCNECGSKFEEPTKWITENGIEHGCPNCGASDLEELTKCEACGNYVIEDDMVGCVCWNCLENTDIDKFIEIGDRCKEEIELNGFLATAFSEKEIEEILTSIYNEIPDWKKDNCRNNFIDEYGNEINDFVKEGGEL